MNTRTLRPVDRLVAGAHAVLAALWIAAWFRAPWAPWLAVAHLCAAIGVPSLLRRLSRRPGRVVTALRELYPMIVVMATWSELGLIRALRAGAFDGPIAALDQWVFGTHLQALWMPAMPQVAFSELMFGFYVLYYPAVFLTPVVLLIAGARREARHIISGLTPAFLFCFASYIVFPVDGPSHTALRYAGPLTEGFLYQLVASVVHAGDSLGTAFPSSHVAGTVTMAILASRWLGRPVAWLFAFEAVAVVAATVYTQNHFAIDALAGVVAAFGVDVMVRARPALSMAAAVPPLPQFAEVTNE